jgi:hypothetical protein
MGCGVGQVIFATGGIRAFFVEEQAAVWRRRRRSRSRRRSRRSRRRWWCGGGEGQGFEKFDQPTCTAKLILCSVLFLETFVAH